MIDQKDRTNVIGLWTLYASTILFFGAIWGICEATLGFILHQALAPFTGMILFPIGYLMMRMAQSSLQGVKDNAETESLDNVIRWTPILVACVAASIKLVDLFVPGALWLPVVNPAMAILMEGLLVSLVMPVTSAISLKRLFAVRPLAVRPLVVRAFAASFGWRILYVLMLTVESSFGLKIRLFKAGTEAVIAFLTIDALINGALIVVIAIALEKFSVSSPYKMKSNPLVSTMLLMMAIMVTLWTN